MCGWDERGCGVWLHLCVDRGYFPRDVCMRTFTCMCACLHTRACACTPAVSPLTSGHEIEFRTLRKLSAITDETHLVHGEIQVAG